MIKTLATASLILATISLTPAEAARRQFWWLDSSPSGQVDDLYADDSFDEQDTFVQDQFNQEQYDLYMSRKFKKKKLRYDQAYYEPKFKAPVSQPKAKKLVSTKILLPQPISKPVSKPLKVAAVAVPISKRFETPIATKSISCTKGASIVADYGFGGVTSKSCAGLTFVYGATRSGKNFDIEVSAATGELTAVKKL
jgi:hypothetical protein